MEFKIGKTIVNEYDKNTIILHAIFNEMMRSCCKEWHGGFGSKKRAEITIYEHCFEDEHFLYIYDHFDQNDKCD